MYREHYWCSQKSQVIDLWVQGLALEMHDPFEMQFLSALWDLFPFRLCFFFFSVERDPGVMGVHVSWFWPSGLFGFSIRTLTFSGWFYCLWCSIFWITARCSLKVRWIKTIRPLNSKNPKVCFSSDTFAWHSEILKTEKQARHKNPIIMILQQRFGAKPTVLNLQAWNSGQRCLCCL